MLPRSPQFGAILFRASELIGAQGARAFEALDIPLPASHISIVLAINEQGPMTSSELAATIGHSRQALEARLKASVKEGFLTSRPDPDDSRRRIYDFAKAARPIVDEVLKVMKDFEAVYDALWTDIGVDLEKGLRAMERALDRKSLTTRLEEAFPKYQDRIESNLYAS